VHAFARRAQNSLIYLTLRDLDLDPATFMTPNHDIIICYTLKLRQNPKYSSLSSNTSAVKVWWSCVQQYAR